jgi:DNA-binding PadR family transcriptional regulator
MTKSPETKLSLTESVVLSLIDEEPRHGFSVARELKSSAEIGQVWMVPAPLVYRAFERLESAGLIERLGTEPGEKGPVRTVFRTTPVGHERVQVWLCEAVAHPREVRTEFIAKMLFTVRLGRSTSALVNAQLQLFQPVAEGLASKARSAAGTDRIVALWRSENMVAITTFLETIAREQDVAPPAK